ncbi:YadA-like family protein [Lonepinella sp. MS14437]|uniref:YadA-like family protein n=1 Tax=Lonepinella sp. MS14437 TaxID=3003620 RepID=UPI0036DE1740
MNHIYKVIWSKVTHSFVVVSELASSQGKPKSSVTNQKNNLSSFLHFSFKLSAIALSLFSITQAAQAVIAIGETNRQHAVQGTATANGFKGHIAYNYHNPENMNYPGQHNDYVYSGNIGASYGIAIGAHATTVGKDNYSSGLAVGDYARSTGGLSIALGAFSQATNIGSTVIGTSGLASGFNSLAIMRQAAATEDYAMAIGTTAVANATGSLAVGSSATAQGEQSIAIGSVRMEATENANGNPSTSYVENNTRAGGDRSIAFGVGAKTKGDDAITIGTDSKAKHDRSIVIGSNSFVKGEDSIVIGTKSLSTMDNAVAIGNATSVTTNGGVALGGGSVASRDSKNVNPYIPATASSIQINAINNTKPTTGAVSVGSDTIKRQIINVAAGSEDTDAVNVAQLKAVVSTASDNIHWNIQDNGTQKSQVKNGSNVNFVNGTGTTAKVSVDSTGTTSTVNYSVNQSNLNVAHNGSVSAVQNGNYFATAEQVANAINNSEKTTSVNSTNSTISVKSTVSGKNTNYDLDLSQGTKDSLAKADSALQSWTAQANGKVVKTVNNANSILNVINGTNIDVSGDNGNIKIATVNNPTFTSVHANTFTAGTVTITNNGINAGNQKITNVVNGTVSLNSTEVVNGSQLYVTNNKVEINSAKLNKGTKYGGDTGTAFTRQLGEQTNVKGGLADTTKLSDNNIGVESNGSDTLTVKLAKELTGLTSATFGGTLINSNGLTITGGPSIIKSGIDAGNKRITNVSAGVNGTDAVNLDQLNAITAATGSTSWKLAVNNGASQHVAANATVNLNNSDSNINLTQSGTSVTFNLADNVNVTNSLKVGNNTVINNNGLSFANSSVAITASGLNNGGNKIVNVANGTVNATSTEVVNGAQLYATNQNVSNNTQNITNITTEIGKGTKYGGDSGAAFTRKLGEQTNVKGGVADTAKLSDNNIGVVSNGSDTLTVKLAKELTGLTSATFGGTLINGDGLTITGGPSITQVGIDAGSRKITNVSAGTNGTDAVNLDQLNAISAAAGSTSWKLAVNNGVSQNVAANTTVNLNNTDNNINLTQSGTSVTFNLANDVNVTNSLKVGNNTVINNNGLSFANSTVAITAGGLNNGGNKIVNVANGTVNATSTEVVNGAQLYATNQNVSNNTQNITNITTEIDKGTKYGGDTGVAFTRKLGEQTNVKGGLADPSKLSDNNIGVVSNGSDTLSVKLAKDLTGLTSAKFGDNTLINSNGLIITGGPSVTQTGIDAGNKKITNVANGTSGTDAVNLDQLNAISATAGAGWKLTVNNSTTSQSITPNTTVNLNNADNNINLTQSGTNVTFNLANDVNVTNSLKVGNNTVINNNGLSFTNSSVAITASGLNNGGNKIVNVTNGTLNATSTDAVNGAQLYATNQNVSNNTQNITNITTEIDKGTKYGGDTGVAFTRKLGEQTNVKGGANTSNLSDNNIGVVSNGSDTLSVKLAKDLTGLTSAKFGDNTLINSNGLIITGGPSVTQTGIDAGNKKITNVSAGTDSTDAVNVAQLNAISSTVNAGWNLTDGTNQTTVKPNTTVALTNTDGNIKVVNTDNNVTFNLADNLNVTSITLKGEAGTNGTIGLDGTNGTIGLTGKDGASANITVANGKNGIDGTSTTRIVYDNQSVATLNDGLFFRGDDSNVTVGKKLNEIVTIRGNLSQAANVTDKNLRVDVVNNDALVVNMAKELTDLTSATFGGVGANTVINKDGVTIINGGNTVSLTNNGLDNGNHTITNVATGVNSTDAVNVAQLNVVNNTVNAGWNLTDGTNQTTVKPNTTVALTNTDGNIKVVNTDNNVTFNLADNLNVTSITLKGEAGTNGTIGLDGTNGTIGLTGKDGASANITVANGKNGIDGTSTTRIVYDNQSVATLNDGLFFRGDDSNVTVGKKLNEIVTIRGNLSQAANVTDKNLRVDVVNNDALVVNMAKELTDLTSATFGGVGANTVINKDGVTIINGGNTVSLTNNGLDNGNHTITNVATGVNSTDAVNVAQLNVVNNTVNAGWNLTDGTNQTTVKPNTTVALTNTDGNIKVVNTDNNVTFNLADNLNVTSITLKGEAGTNGTIGLDGTNGTIGLTGKDGASANITVANGKNGIDGTSTTRIVYDNQSVATLNDGLFFRGDDSNVTVGKKLNEIVTIRGNLSQAANVTDKNLRVDVVNNDALVVNMAKELTDLTSATFGGVGANTVINKDGVTIINGGNTVSLTNNGLDNGNHTITNVAAGVNSTDAVNVAQLNVVNNTVNAGWNLTDGTNQTTVKPNTTVALTNTDGNIKVVNTDNNVTFNLADNLNVTSITLKGEAGTNGTIGLDGTNGTIGLTGKDGASANITVANGKNGIDGTSTTRIVYDNQSVATLNDGLFFRGDDSNVTVGKKLNEIVTIRGNLSQAANVTDKNLRVDVVNNDALVVNMAKELTDLTSATFGGVGANTVINKDGVTIINGGNTVSLTNNGLDNGNHTITNVAAGVNSTDAVNVAQLNVVNNTVNAGWNLTDGTNQTTVRPNSTVALTNTDGNINITNNNGNVTFDLAKDLNLGANGSVTVGNTTVDNNGLAVGNTTVTNNGLTIAGGPSVTQTGIDAGGKKVTGVAAGDISADSTDAVNGSQIYKIEQNVTAAKTEVEAGDNINVTSAAGANGQTVYTVATKRDVNFDNVTVGNVSISKDDGINAGDQKITHVDKGELSATSTDAVNGSQLYQTNQNVTNITTEVNKGWNVTTGTVEGSTGTVTGNTTTKVAMGDTVSVKAGNNIAITQDGKNISIATSLKPTFETVTTETVTVGKGSNTATIGTTEDSNGKAINIAGSDGSSPMRITNVAPGVGDTDAVNVGQLKNVTQNVTKLDQRVSKLDKRVRGIGANAAAASSLPQVYIPGKSMVAAAGGVYSGASALAVGYSRASDNGKVIIKLNGTANSEGHYSGGVGVGYQW